MEPDRGRVQFKLTPEQKEQIRKATGKEADTLEMSVEELEERFLPGFHGYK